MSNVAIFDTRPKCRICGSKSHVITRANPRSPRQGCCASCGVAAADLADWLKQHSVHDLQRLTQVALGASAWSRLNQMGETAAK